MLVGRSVTVGNGVRLGAVVGDGQGVRVAVLVIVGVLDGVNVGLGTAVGGSPSTVNTPLRFQFRPVNICTWYSPGIHSEGSGSQSVKPSPPEPPFQGIVS